MMKTYFKLAILLLIASNAFAQIDRVEPPFWWADMTRNNLQLMFYGEQIAKYNIKTDDAVLLSVQKTENPNYIFVDLDLTNALPGVITLNFNLDNKLAFSHDYELRTRGAKSKLRKGFDSSDLIYLIMPDRFANGNEENDMVDGMIESVDRSKPGGRHGGDISGIIKNLDYIFDLGATCLWSTPLCEDNYDKYSYHHYAQSDVYKIDPRFGTNEDYLKLSQELHQRDMKLIMDYVTNHWSINHWMIKDLPTYDWIHQFPGYANTNYKMTTQFDVNRSKRDTKYCEDGWFVPTMPDLNQSNPLVLNYLIQNAIWWIEYADLDGLRVDTYSYCEKEGIARWTKAIMDEYPNFNIVGEAWLHNQAQISYWQKDSPISGIQNYNTYCPSVMDFTLHDAIMTVFDEQEIVWNQGLIKVYENMSNDFMYSDINKLLLFAENHDTPRINELYPDLKQYKLAMTLIATLRGIPQVYYGSEIGMKGKKNVGDGDIRRDFPGGWSQDDSNAFTEAGRTEKQSAYFEFSKKLFNWRKNKQVVHIGKTMNFIPEDNVFVYFRYDGMDQIMVIINNSMKESVLDLDRFEERLYSYQKATELMSGKEYDLKNPLSIPAESALILEF